MEKIKTNSYDELPYISNAFYSNSLPRLKALLKMLGLETPDLDNARILEIGCSFGGNLIPFALHHPKSQVLGIDLSEIQIKGGKEIVEYLGIDNLELKNLNVMDLNESYGKFDYIICHGVFSWVPDVVKEKILDVVKKQLNKNGAAIISYNTYPGWKNKEILRDIMQFRDRNLIERGYVLDQNTTTNIGRGAIEFLEKFSYQNEHLKKLISDVKKENTHYLYHEYFEEINDPFYVYDFNKLLNKHGLKHFVDSNINVSFPFFQDSKITEIINNECETDRIAKEQYYDYIVDRKFRVSIVVHDDIPSLTEEIEISNLKELYIRGDFPEKNGELYFNDLCLQGEYKNIAEALNKLKPKTIKIEELVNTIGKENTNTYYQKIFELIHASGVEIFSRNIPIKDGEKYLKLSPKYKKYIKYFLENDSQVIGFSNFNNLKLDLPKNILKVAVEFDGNKTDEELKEMLLPCVTLNEGETTPKEIVVANLIKDARRMIESNLMNK